MRNRLELVAAWGDKTFQDFFIDKFNKGKLFSIHPCKHLNALIVRREKEMSDMRKRMLTTTGLIGHAET